VSFARLSRSSPAAPIGRSELDADRRLEAVQPALFLIAALKNLANQVKMEAPIPKSEDTSIMRVKKQREAIAAIQHGNELLKTDLARESRESRYITNPAAIESITRLQDQADLYARKIEQERARCMALDEEIAAAQRRVLEQRKKIGGVNASEENNRMIAKQIRMLENRLDKALVRLNESLAHNKQLREKIDSMRRERVLFDGIYKKLEKELHEKKKEMESIIADSNKAYQGRDRAQSEMMALRQQADKDRLEFEKEWKELGRLIDQDRKQREALRQRQLERTLEARATNALDQERIGNRTVTNESEEWVRGPGDGFEESASQEKTESYEAAFSMIQQATGVSDVHEIVNRFLEAEEKNFSLFNFVNDLNSEIERLELSIAETSAEIDKFRGQGVSTDTQRRKVLRSLEDRLAQTEAKAEEYESRYQTSVATTNQLKTGIHSIFTRIGAGNSSSEEILGNQGVTESNMLQYLALIEQRTTEILQAYVLSQSPASPIAGMKSGTMVSATKAPLPERLMVQPPAMDDMLDSGDESGRDDDERPLTRHELKQKTLRGITLANSRKEAGNQRSSRSSSSQALKP
jgi:hypothetical protein